jgi:hypothetical protein
MTPAEAHKLILQRWMTLWHTLVGGTQDDPAVPYVLDNRVLPSSPIPPYAQVQILNVSSEQVSFGGPGVGRFLWSGFIDVHLFGARDRGRAELDTLAQHVVTIFRAQDLSGVRLWTTRVNEIRDEKDFQNPWCVLARTPFEFHERA